MAVEKPLPIRRTPSGAVVELDKLYIYPKGNGHLTFADGQNRPFSNSLELMEMLVRVASETQRTAKHPRAS